MISRPVTHDVLTTASLKRSPHAHQQVPAHLYVLYGIVRRSLEPLRTYQQCGNRYSAEATMFRATCEMCRGPLLQAGI